MAADDGPAPDPDLYQVLRVPRDASQAEIALAWRRRARAEHPDARPSDMAAPERFRALAEAHEVLSDPRRRAAYDRALSRCQPAAIQIRVRRTRPVRPGPMMAPAAPLAGPPLRAGPVRIERPGPPTGAGPEDITLAVLAELARRHLGRRRDWAW